MRDSSVTIYPLGASERISVDLGVTLGELLEKDMVAVKLGADIHQVAVASPAYLARHGTPATRPICLVRYNPNDREGYAFGYKDMDECDVRSLSSAYADLNVDLQRLGREVLRRRIARHLAPEDRGRFAPEVEEAERQAA